jgi:hypothetical protein
LCYRFFPRQYHKVICVFHSIFLLNRHLFGKRERNRPNSPMAKRRTSNTASSIAKQRIPLVSWHQNVQYRVHKFPPRVHIQSKINPLHAIPFFVCKFHFNKLSFTHRPSKWSFSVSFLTKTWHAFFFLYVLPTSPTYSIREETNPRIILKWTLENTCVNSCEVVEIKTERRLLNLKAQSVPHCKHFSSGL